MQNENNPYKTPETESLVTETPVSGGSLETAVAGQYDFDIGEVLKESWQKTKGLKGSVWGSAIIIYIIAAAVAMAIMFAFGALAGSGNYFVNLGVQTLVQIVVTILIYPFLAGVLMMGVYRAVEKPVSFSLAFNYFGLFVPLAIAAVLISLLTTVGFMLLIIPGLYLSIAYMFSMPLIVDKKLGAWDAMEASRKAITHKWFKVFGVYLLMMLIVFLSVFTIIGIVWTLPMMVAMMGILYRDIFGVTS